MLATATVETVGGVLGGSSGMEAHSWLRQAKDVGGSSIMPVGHINVRAQFLIIEMLTKFYLWGKVRHGRMQSY